MVLKLISDIGEITDRKTIIVYEITRNRIINGLLALAGLALVAGCSSVSAATGEPAHQAASAADIPIPLSVAKLFPAGVFYFQAGVNYASFNIWRMSPGGQEVRLTENIHNFGISAFAVSDAGIVMADAANGSDELARLTSEGTDYLKEGAGSGPYINASGEIAYQVSTYGKSGNVTGLDLMVKKSFSGQARVLYRAKAVLMDTAWGPDDSIAVMTQSHYPGTPGPDPEVIIIDKSGKITTVKNDLKQDIGALVWNEQNGGLVPWSHEGEVIYSATRRYMLPTGWLPATWNPAGTQLLVQKAGTEFGLWTPSRPHVIQVIGSIPKSTVVGQFYWLAKPTKL
jgi:hypothetical protein